MSLLLAILVLNIVIFIHELGHYLCARATRIPVESFSIGMGPLLLAVGFTKDPGDESSYVLVFEKGRLTKFLPEPTWIFQSEFHPSRAIVERVHSLFGTTVWELRLLPVGGFVEINFPKEFARRRLCESLVFFAGPAANFALFFLGSVFVFLFLRGYSILQAIVHSAQLFVSISNQIVTDLAQTIIGNQRPELQGPVGIINVIRGQMEEADGLLKGFGFMLILSLAVGVFNLIPILPLDGGKLLFTWLRALNEKIGERLEMATSTLGILALFVLMIGVTVNDILALF